VTARRYLRHSTIARAWLDQGAECPFDSLVIDPGEPCCFGCGWRTPTPGAADLEAGRDAAWDRVGGLLEKAHLVDHSADPALDTDPLNLVLLCRRCHKAMTRLAFGVDDYEAAVSWVLARPGASWMFQILTDDPQITDQTADANLQVFAGMLDKMRDQVDAEVAAGRL
jgi:hypothetical protein